MPEGVKEEMPHLHQGQDTHGLGAAGKPPALANLTGATAQESSPNKAAGHREWWAKKLDCRRL